MPENRHGQFLAIARIVRPHGRKGEVAAELTTDFPGRFDRLSEVYIELPGSPPGAVQLEAARLHQGRIILKLGGVNSIQAASGFRGRHVFIDYEQRSRLPQDSYYWCDLIGCRVETESAEGVNEIGRVVSVEPTPGVALLHVAPVRPGKPEVLIPLAQSICTCIDTHTGRIVIDPPDGLVDLNDGAATDISERDVRV